VKAYIAFKDEPGFACVATLDDIRAKDGNLSIPLYVAPQATETHEERADYAANGLPLMQSQRGWKARSKCGPR
jgi:type I restriction-modification system DNA methylase subunit